MPSPVTSSSKKPKIQAMSMAAKKEGNDIPIVVMKRVNLLRNLVFNTAARMPMAKPKIMAMEMDTTARSSVFGKASPSTSETLRLLWYDIRKYGAFSSREVAVA